MRVRFVLPVVVVAVVALAQAQQRDPKQYQQVLENPDRVAALQVDKVVASLGLTAGMRVADLGARRCWRSCARRPWPVSS